MRPPFPGMDPWLEHPGRWPDVHNRLIAAIADAIVPIVDPRYYVSVEGRITLYPGSGEERQARPDIAITPVEPFAPFPGDPAGGVATMVGADVEVLEVELPLDEGFEVNETYLEIHEVDTQELITTLEVLSPANKSPGRGREQYLAKRDEVLRSGTNLIEIDLLRAGQSMPVIGSVPLSTYRLLVSRGQARPRARYYAIGLRAAIPAIPIPLVPNDPEPTLELNRVLHELIDRARYFRRIDYDRPPVPPLNEADAAWARAIIARMN